MFTFPAPVYNAFWQCLSLKAMQWKTVSWLLWKYLQQLTPPHHSGVHQQSAAAQNTHTHLTMDVHALRQEYTHTNTHTRTHHLTYAKTHCSWGWTVGYCWNERTWWERKLSCSSSSLIIIVIIVVFIGKVLKCYVGGGGKCHLKKLIQLSNRAVYHCEVNAMPLNVKQSQIKSLTAQTYF